MINLLNELKKLIYVYDRLWHNKFGTEESYIYYKITEDLKILVDNYENNENKWLEKIKILQQEEIKRFKERDIIYFEKKPYIAASDGKYFYELIYDFCGNQIVGHNVKIFKEGEIIYDDKEIKKYICCGLGFFKKI